MRLGSQVLFPLSVWYSEHYEAARKHTHTRYQEKKKNEVNILVLILPRINVALAGFRGLVRQALPGQDLPEAGNEGGPESRRGLSGTRSGRLGSLVLAEDSGTRR